MINKINKLLKKYQLEKYLTKKYLDYALVVFSLLLGFYLKWDLQNIAFYSFVIWIILNPVLSKVLVKIALSFLIFVPFFLILKRNDLAEQFAIFAYYFQILTVIMAIVEFRRDQNSKKLSRER